MAESRSILRGTSAAGVRDERWTHALDGLPVLAFVYRDDERQQAIRDRRRLMRERAIRCTLPYEAEITGIDGDYVYVVLHDEDEPRRLFWCDIRPLAPEQDRQL